jgi:hypothetical protein
VAGCAFVGVVDWQRATSPHWEQPNPRVRMTRI